MTDRPDTNQDLQMTLAQIEETLAHAANPAALVDGVSAQLGTLYTSAEASGDNNAMVAIEQTWNNVQMLAKSVAANREAYLTAKDIAETLRNQRDNIAREHGELIEAINDIDTNHPAIAELAETLQEEIYEYQQYTLEDTLSEEHYEGRNSMAEDMSWVLHKKTGREMKMVSSLIAVLEGEEEPTPEQIDMLGKLIDSTYASRPVVDKAEVARELREWQEGDDDDE